jgi:hypothetical protein
MIKADMKKIILDTNFLLIPGQFNVDIFSELDRICDFKYKLYIVDKSVNELKRIVEEKRGKNRKNANLALDLIKHFKIDIIKTKDEKYADEQIAKLAQKKYIIATQDKELAKRVKEHTQVITLRQKKYLIKTETF